jgi:hypothetical protein
MEITASSMVHRAYPDGVAVAQPIPVHWPECGALFQARCRAR